MTVKERLQLTVFLVGLAVVFVGFHYEVPTIVAATCLGLGLFVILVGLGMVVKRRAEVPVGEDSGERGPREYHSGVTAQLWGLLYVVMGAGLALVGVYATFPAATSVAAGRLLEGPLARDVVVAGAGALFCVYGLTRLLAPPEAFREVYAWRWQRRASGCATVAVGAALLTLAALLRFAPWVLTAMRRAAIALLTDLIRR